MKILARDEDDHDIAAQHLPITPLVSERDANLDRESGSDSALVDHVAPCSIKLLTVLSGPDETFLCYWFLFIFRETFLFYLYFFLRI